jgi:branched-chain amino acid transport system substrate-binding protein
LWETEYEGNNGTYDAVKLWLSEQNYSSALESPSIIINGTECAIDVVYKNSKGNVTLAGEMAFDLILQQNALAIVGLETSTVAIPIAQLANDNNISVIATTATHPNVTIGRPYAFRMGFTNQAQAKVLASLAKFLNASKVSIIYLEDNTYSSDLADALKSDWEYLNGTVTSFLPSSEWNASYSELSSVLASTDLFFFPVTSDQVAGLVNFTRRVGWEGPILGGDDWDNLSALEQCDDACNNSFFTSMLLANTSNPFFLRFNKTYGIMPNSRAALAYDAMNLIKEALIGQKKTVCYENIVSDRFGLRNALKSTSESIGVSGNITFGKKNNPIDRCVYLNFISDATPSFYYGIC